MSRLTESSWQLGAFAFEADFIDVQQLGQAVLSWSSTPDRPLVDILLEQKSLLFNDLALLEAMWNRQESQAGRATLHDAHDQTLNSAARHESGQNNDFFAGSPSNRARQFRDDDRFQIESSHAQGGLGEVFIARDAQLNRTVALKELQPRLVNDPASCLRFQREAEITGSLEHPAIVPIYGAGFRANGAPYYAMRFVAGKTLREVVDHFHGSIGESGRYDGVEFRRLLGRFVDVCRAIGFAHSRQVIHRDIKPANIIFGDHGETMVVDWGLAKRLDQETGQEKPAQIGPQPDTAESGDALDLTVEGTTMGTPAFMSPEQAKGSTNEPGTYSDVFSLGATLHFLLTGFPPLFGKSPGETSAMAAQGSSRSPKILRPTLPHSLDAICIKAMSHVATDRYATAEDLAEDLERWLADEPVSVFADSISQRVGRFTRRNRTLTQFLAAFVAILAIMGTVFSFLLDGQTRIANREKQSAVLLANEKSDLATLEREARSAANEQGKLALDTIHSIVFDIQRKLAPIAPASDVRRDLLQTALQGLSKVSRSLENQNEVDRFTMIVHNEIGMIYMLAGDVSGAEATTTALSHFHQAREIGDQLLANDPSEITAGRDLSIAWEHIGDVQMELGDFDAADTAYGEALQVSLDLAQQHPDEVSVLRDIGFGWEKIGDVQLKRGNVSQAQASIADSRAAFQSMLELDPGNLQLQRDVTVSWQKLGNVQVLNSELEAASESYQECLDRLQAQIGAGSKYVQPRDQSVIYNKLGDVFQKLGQAEQAEEAFESGLTIAKTIATQSPDNVQARRDLSVSLIQVASVKIGLNDLDTARNLLAQSLEIRQKVAESDGQSFVAQTELANVHYQFGKLEAVAGNAEDSVQYYRVALEILEALDQTSVVDSVEHRTMIEFLRAAIGRENQF